MLNVFKRALAEGPEHIPCQIGRADPALQPAGDLIVVVLESLEGLPEGHEKGGDSQRVVGQGLAIQRGAGGQQGLQRRVASNVWIV